MRRLARHVLLWSIVTGVVLAADASLAEDVETPDAQRRAWRYVEKDVTVTIVHTGDAEWRAQRSDGKQPVYDEVERTEDYILLQNRDTKLFIRLHAGRGHWRRPKDEEWTRWVKGDWVEPPVEEGSQPAAPQAGRIRVAYFVPSDRTEVEDYADRIRAILSVVSELYLRDLRDKGYETDGLQFEMEGEEIAVRLVRGAKASSHYNNALRYDAVEQWRRLVPEIRENVGDTQRQVIVVFAETYDDGPAEHLWPGVIARGAYYSADGGLAIYSAHLLRDELSATTLDALRERFFDATPVRGRTVWGGRPDSPRGEFVEDGIGAVAHELGHALGLPHDRRADDRDIMGNGFRNLRRNFRRSPEGRVGFSDDNARLLMSSRYLAADLDRSDAQPPEVQVVPARSGRVVTIAASDETGLRAAVFIDQKAGTVIGGRALEGTSAEFRQRLPDGVAAESLQVIVTDMGGHQTRSKADVPNQE